MTSLFVLTSKSIRVTNFLFRRPYFVKSSEKKNTGVVLGLQTVNSSEFSLSDQGEHFANPELLEIISSCGPLLKQGQVRVLPNERIALVGLGDDKYFSELEERNERKEGIRHAIASGVSTLCRDFPDLKEIKVDSCGDDEAAAEGASLALWKYEECKKTQSQNSFEGHLSSLGLKTSEWKSGIIKGQSQNLARTLMETPSNLLTPTLFVKRAEELLMGLNVKVQVHSKEWALEKKMNSFLSVSKGSSEEPKFLECTYGSQTPDIILVGKGVTFDSGGISLKPSKNMDAMRGDMGGGAVALCTLFAIASLNWKRNLKVLIPLCENMPGPKANKPGDVIKAMNGTTIQVDNTDAEGRLILADALCYADHFSPQTVISIATLTGAMSVALGAGATGVFTNSSTLWPLLQNSGFTSGDRLWRMPLWNIYSKQIKETRLADVNNVGSKGVGGACTAAAFLKEFTSSSHWAHLDIAGVMDNSDEVPYLGKGMAGRPTRTLIEFIRQYKG